MHPFYSKASNHSCSKASIIRRRWGWDERAKEKSGKKEEKGKKKKKYIEQILSLRPAQLKGSENILLFWIVGKLITSTLN